MSSGLSGAGFDVDLRDGKAREDAFAYIVLRARVEVKSDRKAKDTGNVFVEFEQKGRPSGIRVTTADWWAFEVNRDCFVLVPTVRVRAVMEWVMENHPHMVKRGGDFDNYMGVCVPVNWLLRLTLSDSRWA